MDLIDESTAAREAWRRRVVALAAMVAVAFVGLVGQLWYLQVLEGGKLQEMSEKNRIRIRPVAAPRGILFDRNGLALVDNRPAFTLSLINIASWNRYIRASMLEVIRQDYVRTARAKGLREYVVVFRHALRNALIPFATILGLSLPGLIGGAVIVERIFSWPGIGRLAFDAATQRDYTIIMGTVVISSILVIFGNLAADIAYTFLDPRIKQS